MSRRVSFRKSLLRSMLVLIALLSLGIFSVHFVMARIVVRELCRSLVATTADQVDTALRSYFEPIPVHIAMMRDYARSGLLAVRDPVALQRLLQPQLARNPLVSSINIGLPDGTGYLLLEEDGAWSARIVTPETAGKSVEWQVRTETGELVRSWTEEVDYDPRDRPWYGPPAAADPEDETVFWTEPYTFFATRDPGITASARIPLPDGEWAVLALDVLLTDLSQFSSTLRTSPRGMAYVLTKDRRLIGLPHCPGAGSPEWIRDSVLSTPEELGILPISRTLEIMEAEGSGIHGARDVAPMREARRILVDGEAWWTFIRPAKIRRGPMFWVGVAIPEKDFLTDIGRQRLLDLVLSGLTLVGAVLVALRLARRYSGPIRALIRQSDRLSRLDTTPDSVPDSGITELAQLSEAQEKMRVALDSFGRYVPRDVVRNLLETGRAAVLGGEIRTLSILFTDIEGFTSVAESMQPEDLVRHMASYFDELLGVVLEGGGTVDKLIGDAVLAFWGAPQESEHHAADAVRTALACAARLEECNRSWRRNGLPALPTRFGLSTGNAVVGNVGAETRLNYTAIGDTVNLASRLEEANSFFGTRILASAATRDAAGDEFAWRRVAVVRVKGRREPVTIHEPLGLRSEVPAEVLRWAARYEEALDLYLAGNPSGCDRVLRELEREWPEDPSVRFLRGFCLKHLKEPASEGWDGILTLKEKSIE